MNGSRVVKWLDGSKVEWIYCWMDPRTMVDSDGSTDRRRMDPRTMVGWIHGPCSDEYTDHGQMDPWTMVWWIHGPWSDGSTGHFRMDPRTMVGWIHGPWSDGSTDHGWLGGSTDHGLMDPRTMVGWIPGPWFDASTDHGRMDPRTMVGWICALWWVELGWVGLGLVGSVASLILTTIQSYSYKYMMTAVSASTNLPTLKIFDIIMFNESMVAAIADPSQLSLWLTYIITLFRILLLTIGPENPINIIVTRSAGIVPYEVWEGSQMFAFPNFQG